MKPLAHCVNGDGRPTCPPSKVLCRECQDGITEKLQKILDDMDRKAPLPEPKEAP